MSFVLLGILNSQATGGGGAAPAFLSSAPLWLDASDASTITESGGSVSQWDNKGTLENLTQATSADQPTTGVSTLNGLNVIDFNSDFLKGSTKSQWKFLHDGTEYFIAFVAKTGNTASPGVNLGYFGNIIGSADVGLASFHNDSDGTDAFRYQVSNGSESFVTIREDGFITPNTFKILSILADPANATPAERADYFKNNTQGTDTNSVVGSPSTSDPAFNFRLGAFGNDALTFIGSMAEFIIVSGADATETNRQAVVDYLNAKWSVF